MATLLLGYIQPLDIYAEPLARIAVDGQPLTSEEPPLAGYNDAISHPAGHQQLTTST